MRSSRSSSTALRSIRSISFWRSIPSSTWSRSTSPISLSMSTWLDDALDVDRVDRPRHHGAEECGRWGSRGSPLHSRRSTDSRPLWVRAGQGQIRRQECRRRVPSDALEVGAVEERLDPEGVEVGRHLRIGGAGERSPVQPSPRRGPCRAVGRRSRCSGTPAGCRAPSAPPADGRLVGDGLVPAVARPVVVGRPSPAGDRLDRLHRDLPLGAHARAAPRRRPGRRRPACPT